MSTPRIDTSKRRRAMKPSQRRSFQESVAEILREQSRDTRFLADQFDVTIAAMNKRLLEMQSLGMIHSERVVGANRQVPFTWNLGYSAPIVRERKLSDKPVPVGEPKQLRVKSWPALTIPKQNIFSALGL